MKVIDYMRSVDPAYGSQAHQREFIERMDRAEAMNRCPVNHDLVVTLPSGRPAPPCHITACYPTDRTGRMVGA